MKISTALWFLVCLAWVAMPSGSSAQMVIGSWLSGNNDNGWIDWSSQLSITNPANAGIYSFASGAVPGYAQSLQISEAGNNQNLAIKLEYLPGGVAAFLTNHLLSFTFSVPSAASSGVTAGFSQLYQLAINASGYGFNSQSFANMTTTGDTNNNQSGQPNFYFYSGSPVQTQVVTLNYSNILSSITATPSSGYVELIFSFNNGGGAPTNYFINNVTLSGGSGTVVSNPPPPSYTNTVIGSWQGTGSSLSNSLDEGWIDWPTLDSITNPAVYPGIYSFASGEVPGYSQSLQISEAGNNQNLAIKLEYLPGGVAAFLTNHLLSFTFSVPSAASSGVTAGFSQLYQLAINASGYGFNSQSFANMTTTGDTNNNQSGQPNFYFYSGSPVQTQVVTLNYSNILSSITATPSSGYVELVFSFNNGSGAPTNYYINNVVLSGGPVTVVSNPPPPSSTNLFTFTLLNGPTNSMLNSSNGVFSWRPPVSQAGTTNLITVAVTENFAPNLSATNSYQVIVNPLALPVIGAISISGGQFNLTANGTQGPDYTVLASSNLVNWQSLFTTNPPALPLTLALPFSTTNPAQFYRIQIGP